ncbi:MAG: NAD(P)H-binding protein [Chitinophagaceae bacterium]|nr:NAD(P)H-binding protein [Chitinophagaceae bacterium]
MNGQTAVVLGATGLIGKFLVEGLLEDNYFSCVRILARSPSILIHPKLQHEILNFNDENNFTQKFGEGDVIFCCIGTTQKQVKGDNEAYKKIDFDIAVTAAKIGVIKQFKKYLIVSSVGADANSSNFYLQLKGKIENTIRQFPFESISFFRPSMLLGKRNKVRYGENMLQLSMKFFSLLLFGSLKKYHAIKAKDVAKAMIAESKRNSTGVKFYEYQQMKQLIN